MPLLIHGHTKHNSAPTKTYSSWMAMQERCRRETDYYDPTFVYEVKRS